MKPLRKTTAGFIIGVVVCFLLVSTLSAAIGAKHAGHPTHHHTTHKQAWCGWLCAAGQGIQSPILEPPATFVAISTPLLFSPLSKLVILAFQTRSRAPPTPFT